MEFSEIQVEWCKRLIDSGKSVGQVGMIMSLQQHQAARLMAHCGTVVELAPSEEEIREICLRIRRREIVIPGSDRQKREFGFWLEGAQKMADEREYAGAVAGMAETSEPPFAVGDLVSGVTKGKAWSGTICGIDGAWLNVTVDSGLLMVPVGDVTGRSRPSATDFAVGDEVRFRLAGWPNDSSACGRVISVSDATGTLIVHCEGMAYQVNPAVWPAGDRLEV